ncbi:hypothetical protein JQS43_19520 [Natronosporangium hydrolyticum]|uniref:Uncharacterized protein n=1 Tax=Natronosporangium hydrolyticum TaxID=2811111 RepID=A0A895YIY8_9ACTN|nr:hypothetical protein [Natronosporangium hydrolyticum]QSB13738.1 hypothetical protein JQS43_19520 [Natronosporangium hydrolyticum]
MRTFAPRSSPGVRPWFGALLLPVTLLAAGCAAPDAPDPPGSPAAVDAAAEEFDRRAAQLAEAWPTSAAAEVWAHELVTLEPLTVTPAVADEALAQAIFAGWLDTDLELGNDPEAGELTLPDGETRPVPLHSAAEAWAQVATGAPECPDPSPEPTATGPGAAGSADPDGSVSSPALCAVAVVTDARLGAVALATNQGPVEAPAWLFTIDGVTDPLARVAVPADLFADPPRMADVDYSHQPGLATGQHLTAADPTAETLGFQVGVGACDTEPVPVWYETAAVIVVGGLAAPEPGVDMCTDQLVLAEVTIQLAAPVGDRPVLATTGEVLAVSQW